jgi:hypothetical protein
MTGNSWPDCWIGIYLQRVFTRTEEQRSALCFEIAGPLLTEIVVLSWGLQTGPQCMFQGRGGVGDRATAGIMRKCSPKSIGRASVQV